MSEYTTVKIHKSTLARLRRLAELGHRSTPKQIEALVEIGEEKFQIVGVETLPHPPDAEAIPLVSIAPISDK